VLLQGPVRGEKTLKKLLQATLRTGAPEAMATLDHYMRKTARGLAALHHSGVAFGETRTWADELADVREVIARLAGPLPKVGDVVTPLLAHLEALDAVCPADPPLPAHRSFRPAQVLLYEGQVGFIDFDGVCQAEPAMDLALFCATVKEVGLSGALADEDAGEGEAGRSLPNREGCLARLAQLEQLCEAFLATYEALQPVSRQRVALWEALYILTKLLHGVTRVRPARLYRSVLMLARHLEGLVRAVPLPAQAPDPNAARA
jgi:aminoglycoside phosphotransferase (APT) family kinase protein